MPFKKLNIIHYVNLNHNHKIKTHTKINKYMNRKDNFLCRHIDLAPN